MVSFFHEQQGSDYLTQNPVFDALYCEEEEERFDENVSGGNGIGEFEEIQESSFACLSEHDLVWEDDELLSLLSKEGRVEMGSDGRLETTREEAIAWMLKVIGFYGFNAITALLAINYYDRFIGRVRFQKDVPWITQLTAVACLSIAAKVEEIQVPVLLDLQVETKCLFEAKTIQRMELLVLSSLQWKMNPVTPISYIDHIARRFGLMGNRHWDFLSSCESVILSIIADCRLKHYLPSVIATATMIHVINEMMPACDASEYRIRLMAVLRASKVEVDHCLKLIMHATGGKRCLKRKHDSMPGSPSGVMDAFFSCDSSVDSWAIASSDSSSPEPLLKRSRGEDQQMRLSPGSSGFSFGMTRHPH